MILGGAGFSVAIISLALSTAPLDLEETTVTSEQRRNLYRMFSNNDPRDLKEGEKLTLELSEQQLNQL